MRPLLTIALLAAGCGPSDPASRTASTYLAQLDPLLYENGFLAERLLYAAAGVYNDTLKPDGVRVRWEDEIVPLSRHLADQAAVMAPPPEWADRHTTLVGVWGARADAYGDLAIAIEQGDRELWKSATRRADEAKLHEEDWFRAMNIQLAPLGLTIDQFP